MTNKKRNQRGLFIVFEGIDGTGKSTQIKMLSDALQHQGYDVVETREPTDGQYGRKIRELYENRQACTPEEELELFVQDRKEHVQQVIKPALAAGKIVLSDRYYFSTAAYQGAAGHDPEMIIRRNQAFAPQPDLVIHLVLPVQESIHRITRLRNEALNDFEQADTLQKVASIFDGLSGDFIERVDATQKVEVVHGCVMLHVQKLLGGR